jgi:hypothetical protein
MFHLFSKVYVASDSTINLDFDRVVISNKYGIGMYEALDKVSYGELCAYGKTIDSALNGKTFSAFINSLLQKVNNTGKKVIIYVDDNNFSKFMSLWFKSIFLNPTTESSWKIIDDYIRKEKILKNWRYSSTSTESDIFKEVTEVKFIEHFNEAQPQNLSSITSELSFEILLASYLADGTQKDSLKQTLNTLLNRSMQELVIEIKHTYVKNYKKPAFPSLPVELTFFSDSSLYKSESIGRVSGSSSVDLIGATSEDIELFKQTAVKVLTEWDQFNSNSNIVNRVGLINFVRTEITDEQLNYLINFEKTSLSNNRLYSSADEEKINIYFLDFVLNSTQENLTDYILK